MSHDRIYGYNPRNMTKSFSQWVEFIKRSRDGEDIVYRTPRGDICSPARVDKLVSLAKKEVAEFYLGTLSVKDLRLLEHQTLNTWRMFGEDLEREINNSGITKDQLSRYDAFLPIPHDCRGTKQ